MENWSNDGNFIMSLTAAKLSGLYYIIDPNSRKIGGRNVFHIFGIVMVTCTMACLTWCIVNMYYLSNDPTQLVLQTAILGNFVFGCFKGFIMILCSKSIWRCMDITRMDFISTYSESIGILRQCRARSSTFTHWFAVVNYLILFVWSVIPFFTDSTYVQTRNLDGSYNNYRMNPYNMIFFVSSDKYNRWHTVIHYIEWMMGLTFVIIMILFDTFMVTMCIAFTGQLKCVATAYKNLGQLPANFKGANKSEISKKYTDDFKLVIMQHQKVLGKMHDFYAIVRPVILPQLSVASWTVICLSYIATLFYLNGKLLKSAQALKILSFPTFFFQLYYTCFAFGNVNNQKDKMNLALYSSNWTPMDIRFKKSLLLTMNMNNANKLNMKITASSIVNLELFANVIHMCYSIFSVMVNSQLKQENDIK